jgi:hypothetical protein
MHSRLDDAPFDNTTICEEAILISMRVDARCSVPKSPVARYIGSACPTQQLYEMSRQQTYTRRFFQ